MAFQKIFPTSHPTDIDSVNLYYKNILSIKGADIYFNISNTELTINHRHKLHNLFHFLVPIYYFTYIYEIIFCTCRHNYQILHSPFSVVLQKQHFQLLCSAIEDFKYIRLPKVISIFFYKIRQIVITCFYNFTLFALV